MRGKHFFVSFFLVLVLSLNAAAIEYGAPTFTVSGDTVSGGSVDTDSGEVPSPSREQIDRQIRDFVSGASSPDCIVQPEGGPFVQKIVYDNQTIFEVQNNGCGSVTPLEIDSPTGSLAVTYKTIPNAVYYSVEVWGLTEDEAKEFESWGVSDKDTRRSQQFILGQNYFNSDPSDTENYQQPILQSFSHEISFQLGDLIDQSSTQFFPKKNQARCMQKYAWVNDTGADAACKTDVLVNSTWNSFTFQRFYDYINGAGKKFYLVVENTTNPSDTDLWVDSKPVPVLAEKPASEPIVEPAEGVCATVTECLSRLDLKFAGEVFKKKN